MFSDKNRELSYKVSVHCNNQTVIEEDGVKILETINKTHSILETAKTLEVSYRYVWNYIRRIQKLLNQPVVETFKGGKDGGGGAKLTDRGKKLLMEYKQVEQYLANALLANGLQSENSSIPNQFKGKIVAVEESEVNAQINLEINSPLKISTVIAKEAIEELRLKAGAEVAVVIKSAEIKIEK